MTRDQDDLEGTVPLSWQQQVDALLREHERAWKANEQPRIEDCLERVPDEVQRFALIELVAQEVELRQSAGESVDAQEYRERFQAAEIDEAFALALRRAQPEAIGRYRIQNRLGRGTFGDVYLAIDPELDRQIALKVPRAARFSSDEEIAEFVEEARTAAKLDHPGIVTIHDVLRDGQRVAIVQQYVPGKDLRQLIKSEKPSPEEAAGLIASIADALTFAHRKGFVHRDLKPSNILLDEESTPLVADFGLAVHEGVQRDLRGVISGTPAYMSPEQVRGETHRLDGRSDIWSLGVIFYELLVGRRPFAGQNHGELFDEITHREPKPPRQLDQKIPAELERICLKCLSKRVTDRYCTAMDLADDLKHWQRADQGRAKAIPRQAKVVPKGLRAFGEEDSDFFIDLLPGPRDRDGLPESIRFWKTRIEEPDADRTFSVGLIYGPSGCGKSSLVRAGLLPRLASQVLQVYVECTSADTEVRLTKRLRKHFPDTPDDIALPELIKSLREGDWVPEGKKVLVVLDQFEQWLHANREERESQLIEALRHCDGGRVQCIALVRDDFFMATSRFMQSLEIQLVEGRNMSVVDLLDVFHTGKVLADFGRAYGRLPEQHEELTAEQQAFLDRAVNGLSENGKVICVRLALFAEMVKGKVWDEATLKAVGGTEGIGITFLEETFSAATAPAQHRQHERAARGVLKALLPEAGTNIKGSMRSHQELQEASGYSQRRKGFDELIGILDSEIRLITPTDPEGVASEDETPSSGRYYQLTHDYLVSPLRDWLTRKQKETRRGRAELRLAERSTAWNAKPENRHLPAPWEYLNIWMFTRRAKWTDPQQRMMGQSTKVYGLWGTVTLVVTIVLMASLIFVNRSNTYARMLTVVDNLETCNPMLTPSVLHDLEGFSPSLVRRELEHRYTAAEASDSDRLRLAIGLAHYEQVESAYLTARIGAVANLEFANIVDALNNAQSESLAVVRAAADEALAEHDWKTRARLAIVAVYLGEFSIADDMLETEDRPDPVERTVLIAEIPQCHADLTVLADLVETSKSGPTRSGFALGVGSIPSTELAVVARDAWRDTLTSWYGKPDCSTHGASGWALREWGFDTPWEPTPQPPSQRDWWHTRLDLTMVRIPSGQVVTREPFSGPRPIVIDEPFWLSDREISIALFKQFMTEAEPSQRPDDWEVVHPFGDKFDDKHPVQQVSWEDAIFFCNWLSEQHGLDECYEIEPLENPPKDLRQEYTVTLAEGADGFRLPTGGEYEYACRAGTTTDFACGNDANLRAYACFLELKTEPCGSLLCNAWGLFDMHGNVWEWCWYSLQSEGFRVFRGGGWGSGAENCRSSSRRNWYDPADRIAGVGFRVARGPSASSSKPVSGAESESR